VTVTVVILLVCCAFLLWRLKRIRRGIADLIEASRVGRPVLLAERDHLIRGYQLDALTRAFNQLIADKDVMTTSGREYVDQIQTTLGNLREAVVMVDVETVIRLANPAFKELTADAESAIGKRLDLLIEGPAFQELLQKVHSTGEGSRQEMKVDIGGRRRWVEVSAAPLIDPEKQAVNYMLFVIHDITRQKGLEKMRTEFVANVSHELRTLVTIIKGFAETLIEDEAVLTPEEKGRFLRKIRSNSERLHNLLQDLLLLSRLESTEMILQPEAISLTAFFEEFRESWESQLEEKGWKLHFHLAKDHDTIEADKLRLTQVFSNLFDNAIRHARGMTWLKVRTLPEAEGIRILFEDNGIGIPEKELTRVFQRFYRVDKSRSRESGGTGLGLSIVKHIIVQHGGTIQADSGPDKGTVIEIYLPRQIPTTKPEAGEVRPSLGSRL
jgi:PAS domain S-box-containing protein